MAIPPRHPDISDDTSKAGDSVVPRPRLKVVLVVVIVIAVLALFIALHVTGVVGAKTNG